MPFTFCYTLFILPCALVNACNIAAVILGVLDVYLLPYSVFNYISLTAPPLYKPFEWKRSKKANLCEGNLRCLLRKCCLGTVWNLFGILEFENEVLMASWKFSGFTISSVRVQFPHIILENLVYYIFFCFLFFIQKLCQQCPSFISKVCNYFQVRRLLCIIYSLYFPQNKSVWQYCCFSRWVARLPTIYII